MSNEFYFYMKIKKGISNVQNVKLQAASCESCECPVYDRNTEKTPDIWYL